MKTIVRCLIIMCLVGGGLLRSPLAVKGERGLTLNRVTVSDQQNKQVFLYQESHALVIGVSNYRDWPNLPGVQRDVQEVKAALEAHGFRVEVKMDLDKNAFVQAFDEFINQYGHHPDNRLLIYFAGHGHTLKLAYGGEMGYIVPADAPLPHDDEPGFLAKAVDMQMIEVYARRIQSKHALFLFDSCFSGSIFAISRAAPEHITHKTANPVRQFITSGSANETVPDESIFRQQLIAALEGEGDKNKDGYVTGSELGMFLEDTVINYSEGSQHPQYGKIRDRYLDKGDFVFVLPGAVYIEQIILPPTPIPSPGDPEADMWELVKHSDNLSDVNDFLKAFPNGRFSQVARLKLKQLDRQARQTPQPKTEDALSQTPPGSVLLHDDFSALTPIARALFGNTTMVFDHLDGQGCLTALQANVVLPAMYATPRVSDFIAEFDVLPKIVSPESRYGLIFRSDDAPGGLSHYNIFTLQPANNGVDLWAWDQDWVSRADLQVPQGVFARTEIHHVRLEVKKNTVRIFLNGVFVGEFHDSNITTPGIFGLSIISGTAPETVCFDNFTVYSIP